MGYYPLPKGAIEVRHRHGVRRDRTPRSSFMVNALGEVTTGMTTSDSPPIISPPAGTPPIRPIYVVSPPFAVPPTPAPAPDGISPTLAISMPSWAWWALGGAAVWWLFQKEKI